MASMIFFFTSLFGRGGAKPAAIILDYVMLSSLERERERGLRVLILDKEKNGGIDIFFVSLSRQGIERLCH